jgi:hypothetical protein
MGCMTPDDTQWRGLRLQRLTRSIAAMHLKRHMAWIVAALASGVLVLPLFVYYTGLAVIGPYANGGPLQFLGDCLADFTRLRPGAWLLLLGPATLILVWRVLVAYAWPRSGH